MCIRPYKIASKSSILCSDWMLQTGKNEPFDASSVWRDSWRSILVEFQVQIKPGYMLTSFLLFFMDSRYILYIPLKRSILLLKSWSSAGYFSNSTGSSVTSAQFSLFIVSGLWRRFRFPLWLHGYLYIQYRIFLNPRKFSQTLLLVVPTLLETHLHFHVETMFLH